MKNSNSNGYLEDLVDSINKKLDEAKSYFVNNLVKYNGEYKLKRDDGLYKHVFSKEEINVIKNLKPLTAREIYNPNFTLNIRLVSFYDTSINKNENKYSCTSDLSDIKKVINKRVLTKS